MSVDLFEGPKVNIPDEGIDFGLYLSSRSTNEQFSMVEIGHSAWPVAYQQNFDFDNQRKYVGVESWLRDPALCMRSGLLKLIGIHGYKAGVTFLDHDLGGIIHNEDPEDPYDDDSTWYEGTFEPKTSLDTGVADEVFASNVFGDPLLAYNYSRTRSLLVEMRRLAKPEGVVLLRETVSPEKMIIFNEELIACVGLKVLGGIKLASNQNKIWQSLEHKYAGDPTMPCSEKSLYLALGKASI